MKLRIFYRELNFESIEEREDYEVCLLDFLIYLYQICINDAEKNSPEGTPPLTMYTCTLYNV